ncbi:MAG TPA: hypothetical protein VGE39_11480, partial [Prosthecobacter sp.]
MSRFLTVAAVLACFVGFSAIHAQQPAATPHPALQSQEAFLAELAGKKWECSFTTLPELRFHADKIEVIAPDGKVSSTLSKVSHPEPGMVRVDYRTGFQFFIFADDMESFVLTSMQEQSGIEVGGGGAATKLPVEAADAPLTISFTDNPFWKQARLGADKMEILDGSGNVFATNPAFSYTPHVMGVALPEKKMGAVILSRQKPGTGWYVNGNNLGVGVRTDKSGYFRTFLRTQLSGYPLRSAHFNYPLLIAGKGQLATAHEHYAVKLVGDQYGDNSDKVAHALNEMGTLRRYARSYTGAAALHAQALAEAKTRLASDKPKLLDFSTDLAVSQNDSGDFAGAKKTLAEAYALLPAPGGNVYPTYFFYEALAMAEFGLRDYPVAAQHFIDNSKRAREGKIEGSVLQSLLYLMPCQLAQNQTGLAEATLAQAMQVQKARQDANTRLRYDTWELAFACVALGKNKEALQWARVSAQRKNWVSYEEYGHLVSLLHGGDRAAAQSLAKDFIGRFGNMQEDVNVRNDIDPITVKLTVAIAEPTPAN